MPARISEIGMIETWRGGAIVTGAVAAEAGADDAAAEAVDAEATADGAEAADAEPPDAEPPDGEATAMRETRAATAKPKRSSRAVGRSNIGSSVRGVSRRVKRSLSFLETSA